jgi:hypothetical protein
VNEGKQTAVTEELDQFNKYKDFELKHANDLSEEDRKKALSSLIFLKEKKSGAIKARSCANGSVQREHAAKEEAAAPTVGLDSVFITSTIDAKESRKLVTINIPGTACDTRKRKIRAVSRTAEGTIWHDEERIAVLQKTGIGTTRDGF